MRVRVLVVTLMMFVLSACGSSGGDTTSGSADLSRPKGGQTAAAPVANDLDFTSTTVSGDSFSGMSLAGKPTVLWFWAPWCPTCRGQVDGVSALAEKYADQVQVVGVGSLDDSQAIDDFAAKVSGDVTMLDDAQGEVWRHFKVTAQSTYLVLDADGKAQATGYLSDDELDKVVASTVG